MPNPFITLAAIIDQYHSAYQLAEYAHNMQRKVFVAMMVNIKKDFVTNEEITEHATFAFNWWNAEYKGE